MNNLNDDKLIEMAKKEFRRQQPVLSAYQSLVFALKPVSPEKDEEGNLRSETIENFEQHMARVALACQNFIEEFKK